MSISPRTSTAVSCCLCLCSGWAIPLPAQATAAASPRSPAEASDFNATSTAVEAARFIDAVVKLPHGNRLTVQVAGKTHGGRAQVLVKMAAPGGGTTRMRALVIGNIHGGEVEGKEAILQLVREVAEGQHIDIVAACDVWLLPIYNVDGNEALDPKNRAGQNGPDLVGKRTNDQDLDLNRDFVKVDAPETRTLLRLFGEIDPHLFVDLHTTNGSHHGYHLTYAPSLSPNVDREVARLSRSLLDDATAAMARDGFRCFDYGNFETRDWENNGAPESPKGTRGWFTYDHRARYGVNYFGLRNRIGILSEAYSCADFPTRIAATRSFVLALLRGLVARRAEVDQTVAAADLRLSRPEAPQWFGFDTTFAAPEQLPVLVGEVDRVERGDGKPLRFVMKPQYQAETMPVVRAFCAREQHRLPEAWAILEPPPAVLDRLRWHGIEFAAADAPKQVFGQRFAVTAKKKPKRPYQGHQELVLAGAFEPPAQHSVPLGTIIVKAHQRFARLAATLLEPNSEDSLSSWNFFEAQTADYYPVLRVLPAK